MKLLKTAVVLFLSLGSVAMAARPSTWLMTCNDAERLVARNHGVVMNYAYSPKAGYLYKKYFRNDIYCETRHNAMKAKRAIVKTADNDRCDIGYTCTYGDHAPN